MRLFIIDKKRFDEAFSSTQFTAKEIHQSAFNTLRESIAAHNSIPIGLFPDYKDEGKVILDFVSVKDDVYYYKYETTVS